MLVEQRGLALAETLKENKEVRITLIHTLKCIILLVPECKGVVVIITN